MAVLRVTPARLTADRAAQPRRGTALLAIRRRVPADLTQPRAAAAIRAEVAVIALEAVGDMAAGAAGITN